MKKTITAAMAVSALLFLSAPLPAQMDNLTNLSVEWMRLPARNAASDSADIVVYNPAALVRLPEGFHLNLGNQTLMRKPSHTYDFGLGAGERTFSQEGIDPFLPNFYAAYTKGKWAVYGGVYISGGGAVALRVRTANSNDMSDARAWTNVSPVASSGDAISPGNKRYVQFRADLTPNSTYWGSITPTLKDVAVDWQGEKRVVDVGGTFTKGR